MADISKCIGENCSIKEKCYRFKAEDNKYGGQSYFVRLDASKVEKEIDCDYFIKEGWWIISKMT